MWRNGRRACLRCMWRDPWGFKSPHRQLFFKEPLISGYIFVFKRVINLKTSETLHARKVVSMNLDALKVKANINLMSILPIYYGWLLFKYQKPLLQNKYGCSVGNLYNFLNKQGHCT